MNKETLMTPNSWSLEYILFNPFSTEDILPDDNFDPDKQFFNDSDNFYDTPHSSPNEANVCFKL